MKIVHVTERQENGPLTRAHIANTNDVGVAWCFGATEHRSSRTPLDAFADVDVMVVTMTSRKVDWEAEWMELPRLFKERWPGKKVVIYQEKEAGWPASRPWSEQQSFYRTVQGCDLFLTHNVSDEPLYRLMCRHPRVHYFPAVQDVEMLQGIRRQDDGMQSVAVACLNDRWNGLQAALLAKDMGYPVVNAKKGVFVDGRDEECGLFSKSFGTMGWIDWATELSKCWVYLHPLSVASAGRDQIACAAIGVPIIGNKWSTAQTTLWPSLAVDPYDVLAQVEKLKRLENDMFYQACVLHAHSQLGSFDLRWGKELAETLIQRYNLCR